MVYLNASSPVRVGSSESKPQGSPSASRQIAAGTEVRFDSADRSASAPHTPAFRSQPQHRGDYEAKLAQVLAERLPQHAAMMLDATGTIVHWSVGAEKMLGFTAAEVLGRSHTLLFVASEEVAPHAPLLPSDGSLDRHETEATFVRRDGSIVPVRLVLVPCDDSEPSGDFALLVHDVTERNRIEELLRNRFTETAHLARLSTIGQMTAELAHEINQPLAAAANYARACVNFGRSGRFLLAPEAIEWMERSAEQALRAVQISKRLGAFVRKVDGHRTSVQINTSVEQTLLLTRSMMMADENSRAPIEIHTDFDRSAPEIIADPVQVEQVLLNLIRNAVEAMQELKTRPHTLAVRTAVDAGFVTVTVGDSGPGIAPDKLAGLFDPFFTTKPSGLGLGLSISRAIVEQHGGRMTVESSSAGSAFSFTLPMQPGGPLSC